MAKFSKLKKIIGETIWTDEFKNLIVGKSGSVLRVKGRNAVWKLHSK